MPIEKLRYSNALRQGWGGAYCPCNYFRHSSPVERSAGAPLSSFSDWVNRAAGVVGPGRNPRPQGADTSAGVGSGRRGQNPARSGVAGDAGKMERWDPFLTTNDSGYPLVMELSGLDREQAAQVLLQALVHQMIATAP